MNGCIESRTEHCMAAGDKLEKLIVSSIDDLQTIVKRIQEKNDELFSNYEKRICKVEQSVRRWNILGICIVIFCAVIFTVEVLLLKHNTVLEKRDITIEQAVEQIRNELNLNNNQENE